MSSITGPFGAAVWRSAVLEVQISASLGRFRVLSGDRPTGVSRAIGISPGTARRTPRWRPPVLPSGGQRFSPRALA